MSASKIPHLRVVVAVSAFVLMGFAAVSAYVLAYSSDDVTKGNVIGTWINFAMLAVGFWIGSSSGGKMNAAEVKQVEVVNPPSNPVSVHEEVDNPDAVR